MKTVILKEVICQSGDKIFVDIADIIDGLATDLFRRHDFNRAW